MDRVFSVDHCAYFPLECIGTLSGVCGRLEWTAWGRNRGWCCVSLCWPVMWLRHL